MKYKVNRFETIIFFTQLTGLYIAGIVGNELGGKLILPPRVIFLVTSVFLLALTIIALIKPHNGSVSLNSLAQFKPENFFSKTFISFFQYGSLMGFLLGTLLSKQNNLEYFVIIWPLPFGFTRYELLGLFICCLICFMFVPIGLGKLCGVFSIGYGISFATAVLIVRPFYHYLIYTYVTYTLVYLLLTFFPIFLSKRSTEKARERLFSETLFLLIFLLIFHFFLSLIVGKVNLKLIFSFFLLMSLLGCLIHLLLRTANVDKPVIIFSLGLVLLLCTVSVRIPPPPKPVPITGSRYSLQYDVVFQSYDASSETFVVTVNGKFINNNGHWEDEFSLPKQLVKSNRAGIILREISLMLPNGRLLSQNLLAKKSAIGGDISTQATVEIIDFPRKSFYEARNVEASIAPYINTEYITFQTTSSEIKFSYYFYPFYYFRWLFDPLMPAFTLQAFTWIILSLLAASSFSGWVTWLINKVMQVIKNKTNQKDFDGGVVNKVIEIPVTGNRRKRTRLKRGIRSIKFFRYK